MRTRKRDPQIELAWRQLEQIKADAWLVCLHAEATRRAIEQSRRLLEQTSSYARIGNLVQRHQDPERS